MIAGCGVVQRIFSPRPGPMGKKLAGDIAGIVHCSCSGGQIPILSEKILRCAYLFMCFYRLYFQKQ
jgi:hypothetical protein